MFGVDPRLQFTESDSEMAMDNNDAPPQYTHFSPEWTEHAAVELSSGREDIELPADHGVAELFSGNTTLAIEPSGQEQFSIHELAVADGDATQVPQYHAYGNHQPAELPAGNNYVPEDKYPDSTQTARKHGWEITPPDYEMTPEALLNGCPFTADSNIMDSSQQKLHASNVDSPYDFDGLVSPVEGGVGWNERYTSTCDVSPFGSFTETDIDVGTSVFSLSPSRSTTETSVSSLDSIMTPPDHTVPHAVSLFGEPDMVCEDPIEDFGSPWSINNPAKPSQTLFYSFSDEPDRVSQEPHKEDVHWSAANSTFLGQNTTPTHASPQSSCSTLVTDQCSSASGSFSIMWHEAL